LAASEISDLNKYGATMIESMVAFLGCLNYRYFHVPVRRGTMGALYESAKCVLPCAVSWEHGKTWSAFSFFTSILRSIEVAGRVSWCVTNVSVNGICAEK